MPRINKRTVDSLKPSERGQTLVWDDALPGFGLRVTTNGVKAFILQYRNRFGKSRRFTIGRYGPLTPEQARRRAKALLGQVSEGKDPLEARQQDRREGQKAISVKGLCERYLHDYARVKKKPKSFEDDERNIKTHVNPALGKKKVLDITRTDIITFHNSLSHIPYAANRCLALLSKMFNLAEEWGLRPDNSNPCRRVETFKENSRDRFLQPEELPRFFEALAAEKNETARDFFLLCLLTGARRRNVQAMRWEQINWQWATWTIPETKTDKGQVIPLCSEAITILSKRKEKDGDTWVFPAKASASGHIEHPAKAWKRVLERANVKDLRIHDLRRTLGSWQAAQGTPLNIIGKSLGHKDQRATEIYARLGLDPVRRSIEAATQKMLENGSKRDDE